MLEQSRLLDLLERCKLKDQSAFKELFELSAPVMNAIVYRMVRDRGIAEDVLQEAYAQIWHNAQSFSGVKAKPLSWMISIARYRALDRLDKEKRYVNDERVADRIDETSESSTIDSNEEQSQKDAVFLECMNELNERVRQAIRLAYINGLSRDAIAELYETKVNTVKSWLKRGSEALQQCIQMKIR